MCVAGGGKCVVCRNLSGILDDSSFVSGFHCLSTMKMYECFSIYNKNHSLTGQK